MSLTGAQVIVQHLINEGCPYIVGIPGHGNLPLADALRLRSDRITALQVLHEACGVHLAEGYYRVTGKPLAVFTSIGPGALNTAIGLANAYADSTAVLALTGDTHVHMHGKGVLQELERRWSADNFRALEPVTKRAWRVTQAGQLPHVMHRAFNLMTTGRPGPVAICLPMDVQAAATDALLADPATRLARARPKASEADIEAAAALLAGASRPVILVGGGVISADASAALRRVADATGAAVVNTMMGMGAFPADHPLYGWATGSKGTTCGLKLTASADVLLAVGCRFADETTSSYRQGISFSIPPTRLIQIDLDPSELGKNYPLEVGLLGDARSVLEQLAESLEARGGVEWQHSPYTAEIARLRAEWFALLAAHRAGERDPVMISTVLQELRPALDRDAIVVSSSGNVQAQLIQEFPFYEPRTCLTAGGFSTMGWTLPATLGAKLAAPDRQVIGLMGDGETLMQLQELATAVRHQIPAVYLVLNNMGWISIRDLQQAAFGEEAAFITDFTRAGENYSPDFAAVARDFGAWSKRISRAEEVAPAIQEAFQQDGPAVIEVMVNREFPYTGTPAVGWWDVPIPTYMTERRAKYETERDEECLS